MRLTVWIGKTTAAQVDIGTLGLSKLELACVGDRRPIVEVAAESAEPTIVAQAVRSHMRHLVQDMETSKPPIGFSADVDVVMWLPYLRAAATGELCEDELARLPADGRAERLRHACAEHKHMACDETTYMRRRSDGGIERPCGKSYYGGETLWSTKDPSAVFDLEIALTDRVENDLPVWRVDATESGPCVHPGRVLEPQWKDTKFFSATTKDDALRMYCNGFVGRHAYVRLDGAVHDVLDLSMVKVDS